MSTATVGLIPRDPIRANTDMLDLLGESYVIQLGGSQVESDAIAASGVASERLQAKFRTSITPGTINLNIRVSSEDPVGGARAANYLADHLVRIGRSDEIVQPVLIAPALAPSERSAPSPSQLFAIGGVAGLTLSIALGVAVERRPKRGM